MNKHNFYIILLSFPHLLTAQIVTNVKQTCRNSYWLPNLPSVVHKLYPMSKSSLLPVYLNEVLLKHNQVYSFTHYLWLCLLNNGRVEYLRQKADGLQSQKYLLLDLYRKSLQTLALDHHEYTEESQNVLKNIYISSTPWPKLKKGREKGICFNGEWNVKETTYLSILAADTIKAATLPLKTLKVITPLPGS